MSIQLALSVVILVALVGNRIFSLLAGLILRVPASILLPTVLIVDLLQIPMFYWLYEHGSVLITKLPPSMQAWFEKGKGSNPLGRWTSSIGGFGVFIMAALPTFGGGMWSAVFLAYSLNLKRTWSYLIISLGSLVSYLSLYWVLDTLVRTVRYFSQ